MNTTPTTTTTTIARHPSPGAAGEIETSAMANCLKLLSASQTAVTSVVNGGGLANSDQEVGRMFACKTCDKKFSSFQALGGHRASHKKIKPLNSDDDEISPAKAKVHVCKYCGAEFATGQALGGHMRRHRETLVGVGSAPVSGLTTEGSSGNSDSSNNEGAENKRKINEMKSSSCKRVCLDLTLWNKKEEDDYEIEEGEIVEQRDPPTNKNNNNNISADVMKKNDFEEEKRDFLKLELRQPINCW